MKKIISVTLATLFLTSSFLAHAQISREELSTKVNEFKSGCSTSECVNNKLKEYLQAEARKAQCSTAGCYNGYELTDNGMELLERSRVAAQLGKTFTLSTLTTTQSLVLAAALAAAGLALGNNSGASGSTGSTGTITVK